MQNPRRVYNVQLIRINVHGIIHVLHTRTNACVYGEVYGNLAKTKALRSTM